MRENALKALQCVDEQEKYNALFEVLRKNNPDKQDLREFNKGFSKGRLESLEYKIKKAYSIKDLEVYTENVDENEEEEDTDKAVLPGGSLPGGKPKPKGVEADAEDMEPIRSEFPFLADENCPDVLLIAVGKKITAYKKEKEINAKIIALKETNPESEELTALAEQAIHYFNENEKLYKELKHYGETGEILGEHELFVEFTFKKEVEAMNNKALIAYQGSSKKFFTDKKKKLESATDEAEIAEIQKAIAARQVKLNLVNKALGV